MIINICFKYSNITEIYTFLDITFKIGKSRAKRRCYCPLYVTRSAIMDLINMYFDSSI